MATTLCAMPAARAQSLVSDARVAANAVFEERDDPATGDRWLLLKNPAHPAAPGQWVREGRLHGASASQRTAREIPMVIHAGDRVVVEEHSAVADARLAARALDAAPRGGTLRVRLEVGGKVLRALAVAPGRARLLPESGSAR